MKEIEQLSSNPSWIVLGYSRKNGQLSTAITLFKNIVGLGIMTNPIFFAQAGWILSTATVMLVSFLVAYNMSLLSDVVLHIERMHTDADVNQIEDCFKYLIQSPLWKRVLYIGEPDQSAKFSCFCATT